MPVSPMVHAARLIVKPRPSTLSESFAVLRYLQKWGEVTKFKKYTGALPETGTTPFHNKSSDIYTVEFSSFSKPGEHPHKSHGIRAFKFRLDANAGHPDPYELDPYNVRGLLDRKPNLEPRRFNCKMIMLDGESSDNSSKTSILPRDRGQEQNQTQTQTQLDDSHTDPDADQSEYSNAFTVDTHSIWGAILQQAGAPKHMITGLLPKIDDDKGKKAEEQDRQAIAAVDLTRQDMKKRKASAYFRRRRALFHPKPVKKDDFSLMKLYRGSM